MILVAMVVSYALAARKFSVELSLLAMATVGGIVGSIWKTPPIAELGRHLVEGSMTYLDMILIFTTATIFMEIVKASGGVNFFVRATLKRFHNRRVIVLCLLLVLILVPGALTGAGSVSLLVVGSSVALALRHLGISNRRIAATLFITAGLSAACPPVNIWAMIVCAGTAIPYVGFELPLLIPVVLLGLFTMFFLGWKGKAADWETMEKDLPAVPKGMTWGRMLLPFIVFFGTVAAARIWPFSFPLLGLPLQFTISALVALAVSPVKINVLQLAQDTIRRLLPLLSTVAIVGVVLQIMTATGVRGLFAYLAIITPLTLLFILLAFIIPLSEGVLTYGGAAVFGIPLIWYLNSLGFHPTVALAGLSLLWPLGDGLPPTALIGRLSVMVAEFEGGYWEFLKSTAVPWIVITVVGILMVVFSSQLSFLVI